MVNWDQGIPLFDEEDQCLDFGCVNLYLRQGKSDMLLELRLVNVGTRRPLTQEEFNRFSGPYLTYVYIRRTQGELKESQDDSLYSATVYQLL